MALTIIVGQVPKLLGIDSGEGDFFEKGWDVLKHLGETDGLTLLVGGLSLIAVLGLRRLDPRVPGSLIVVFAAIAAVHVFGLDDEGVSVVGHIDAGLPSFGLPDASGSDYGELAAGAIGVMLVGFAESLGAAKTYASRNHYEIDANRELLGLGAANLGSGISGGMVVNGSLSKTAVNATAGAKTQLSGLLVAVLTVLTLLLLTGLFESLPDATLAAVVIAALVELVDFAALRDLYRVYTSQLGADYGVAARPDFIAAIAAMLGVLVFDTLPGLFIGIAVSLTLQLYRASSPHISELGRVAASGRFVDLARHEDAERVPGISVLRVESGIFFANADHVRQVITLAARRGSARAVILDAETVPFIDVSAARVLVELAGDLQRDGVELLLANSVGQVSDVIYKIAGDRPTLRLAPNVTEAIAVASGLPD